jgi:hypothetical protein
MALWLDLIPRLHRSDGLPSYYHQLNDWTDSTSFEADGTRPISLDETPPPPRLPRTEYHFWSSSIFSSAASVFSQFESTQTASGLSLGKVAH